MLRLCPSHVVQSAFRVWFHGKGGGLYGDQGLAWYFSSENRKNSGTFMEYIRSSSVALRERLSERKNYNNYIPHQIPTSEITIFPRGNGSPVYWIEASKKAAATYKNGVFKHIPLVVVRPNKSKHSKYIALTQWNISPKKHQQYFPYRQSLSAVSERVPHKCIYTQTR